MKLNELVRTPSGAIARVNSIDAQDNAITSAGKFAVNEIEIMTTGKVFDTLGIERKGPIDMVGRDFIVDGVVLDFDKVRGWIEDRIAMDSRAYSSKNRKRSQQEAIKMKR